MRVIIKAKDGGLASILINASSYPKLKEKYGDNIKKVEGYHV